MLPALLPLRPGSTHTPKKKKKKTTQTTRAIWNDNELSDDEQPASGNDKDKMVAKTAGFVVFSGIAMSILKALNPYNKADLKMKDDASNTVKCGNAESINLCTKSTQFESEAVVQQCQPSLHSHQEPIIKEMKPSYCVEPNVKESSARVIDIVRGDTLWGLSRKYGVSIEAIKQANGPTGTRFLLARSLSFPRQLTFPFADCNFWFFLYVKEVQG